MGFWVFMLMMDLLIPFMITGFGYFFLQKAPANINALFGYRTRMSMKNQDTWKFAHRYFGKLWYMWGRILLFLTVLVMLWMIGKSEDTIGTVGAILCHIQMIPLIGCIVPTERALKRHFDANGNRRV